jgi:hypothetical protein
MGERMEAQWKRRVGRNVGNGNGNGSNKMVKCQRETLPMPRLIKPRPFERGESLRRDSGKEKLRLNGENGAHGSDQSDVLQLQVALEDKSRQLYSSHFQLAVCKLDLAKKEKELQLQKTSLSSLQSCLVEEKKVMNAKLEEKASIIQEKVMQQANLHSEVKRLTEIIDGYKSQIEKETPLKVSSHMNTHLSNNCIPDTCGLDEQGISACQSTFAESIAESRSYVSPPAYHTMLINMSESLLSVIQSSRNESAFLKQIIASKDSEIKMLMNGKS